MYLKTTPNLTTGFAAELADNIRWTHSGQAFWAGTGPAGATCGDCIFWGYSQVIRSADGNAVGTKKSCGCAKFHQLTGKHGPAIPDSALACKYFENADQ